jgi:outer membrane lipoprotein-sorting protein
MKGRFLQDAADGVIANGVFYLRRPRRFRFEYAPPSPVLLVGDGLWLIFHDRELGQVSRVPLISSPLSLLIDDEVSLTDHTALTSIVREPGVIRITLNDPEKPEQGELTLVLTDPPLALRQWVVTDAQGLTTRISLFETETNVPLEAKLFTFTDPPPGRN